MKEPKDAPPLVAAPRHLRRRTLHDEIPDELLVPGVKPLPLEGEVNRTRVAKRKAGTMSGRVEAFGRKRTIALLSVIFVSISIPALVLALIFAG